VCVRLSRSDLFAIATSIVDVGSLQSSYTDPNLTGEHVIEVLAKGLPGGADVTSKVSFSEHVIEMSLCGAQPTDVAAA